ncbi:hypothetical protein BN439_2239 [Erwinia amylovora Ea644]|nr:hypothetical protein BN439_2239 [Erwinia amylovora Ea644]CCP07304.1 hypothetical protein BN440_2281 [Erwinia amylovora MR1]
MPWFQPATIFIRKFYHLSLPVIYAMLLILSVSDSAAPTLATFWSTERSALSKTQR